MDKHSTHTAIIAGDVEVSYELMLKRAAHYASLLPDVEDGRIVIFSENRIGWVYAFFSIWHRDYVAVPIDAGSTAHDVAYILSDCRPQAMWVSHATEPVARQAIAEAGVDVELLFLDEQEEADAASVPSDILQHTPWSRLDIEGNKAVALIIYTSGTTGMPKGVMLSYDNLKQNVNGVCYDVEIFTPERRTMILLPLHHVLPLMGTLVIPIYKGGGVAICPSLSGPDLMQTLVRGKVAIVVGVPRLYQTLFSGIKKKLDASPVTRALFSLAEKVGSRRFSRLLFGSLRKKMGGHITYFVSGGAALDKEIGNGMRTLGLDVLEGYGMTECAPMISFTRPGDIKPGCAGLPLSCVECRLIDGELCVRGRNVMLGYYNRPEETAQVIDSNGFLHTGDLATIDDAGRITITGRSKEIIVLSNGKNVQPNEIEFKLEQFEQYVKEAAVVQDGDLLRAIIVPKPEWAASLSDAEAELALKREVLEPYNHTVSNYKKLMSLMVYRGDLPRTRMEKLQRFKLKDIIKGNVDAKAQIQEEEPALPEYKIIKTFIENEKKVKVRTTSHIETDLAMDSLDKIGLQGFIEHTFGVRLKAEEMACFANIMAMAEFVAEKKTHTDVEDVDWTKFLATESSGLVLPRCGMTYPIFVRLFKYMLKVWNTLTIKGRENIPSHGPYILAPNHQSFVDGPVALSGLSWNGIRHCYSYATEDHVRSERRRRMAANSNIIVMERANLKDSILKMAEVLKQGQCLLIFPEGSRSHDGDVEQFKKTFAILAVELGVPVVPVRITGAFQAFSRYDRYLKPRHIQVEYMPPITPERGQDYSEFSDLVRTSIL